MVWGSASADNSGTTTLPLALYTYTRGRVIVWGQASPSSPAGRCCAIQGKGLTRLTRAGDKSTPFLLVHVTVTCKGELKNNHCLLEERTTYEGFTTRCNL